VKDYKVVYTNGANEFETVVTVKNKAEARRVAREELESIYKIKEVTENEL
jgi:hypothetical protein